MKKLYIINFIILKCLFIAASVYGLWLWLLFIYVNLPSIESKNSYIITFFKAIILYSVVIVAGVILLWGIFLLCHSFINGIYMLVCKVFKIKTNDLFSYKQTDKIDANGKISKTSKFVLLTSPKMNSKEFEKLFYKIFGVCEILTLIICLTVADKSHSLLFGGIYFIEISVYFSLILILISITIKDTFQFDVPQVVSNSEKLDTKPEEQVVEQKIEKIIFTKKELNEEFANIDSLDGYAFEEYLANIFSKLGFISSVTQKSGDYGADLILEKDNISIVVQAKRYKGNIGNSAVQEIYAAQAYYKANKAWVVTNSYFTANAIQLAKNTNVMLIDRDELKLLVYKAMTT
ncbi:restriction endonuclease [Rummeliibacillus pycnus]|uniref:restriction endonuclease n=1 Tax=Rummeliibacillus pycnus TaxID=101070 RepID=UPI003D2A271C